MGRHAAPVVKERTGALPQPPTGTILPPDAPLWLRVASYGVIYSLAIMGVLQVILRLI